jgi:hypothetical protein
MHRLLRDINQQRIQNPSVDLRGDGVAEFIDHYIDPGERGFDALRTARELVSILSEVS